MQKITCHIRYATGACRTKSAAAMLLTFWPFCLSAVMYDRAEGILHCGCNTSSPGLLFCWSCNVFAIWLQTDKDKLNDSYAALERKAELYDKLSRGQYDDDEEQYNVDFLSKGFLTDEMRIGSTARQSLLDPASPIDTSAMAVQASGIALRSFYTCAVH